MHFGRFGTARALHGGLVVTGTRYGANTAIFRLIDSVLLRSPLVQNPRELRVVNIIYQPGEQDSFPAHTLETLLPRLYPIHKCRTPCCGIGQSDLIETCVTARRRRPS